MKTACTLKLREEGVHLSGHKCMFKRMEKMIRPLCLHASSFAAFVGENPYERQTDAFEKVWSRCSPDTYRAALDRNHKVSRDDKVHRLKTIVSDSFHMAQHLASAEKMTSTGVAKANEELQGSIPKELEPEDAKILGEELKKQLFTSYGTTKEKSVLDVLKKDMEMDIAPEEDITFSKTFETPDGVPWKLVGKIDARTTNGEILIEVKNRVRRLFMTAPKYERIQVECYLRLVESAQKAFLVECLRQDDVPLTLNIIPIEKDDALWESLLARAHATLGILKKMIDDEDFQDKYMQSKRPSMLLRVCSN